MHDGWCCKQNALALASPHPHSSRTTCFTSNQCHSTTHSHTHRACVPESGISSTKKKTFQPALLAQESHTRTNTAAPDGLPARHTGRPSSRPIATEPPVSSPSVQQDIHDASPQYCLIRHLVSHRGCLPGFATPMAPPRGHPPDNTPTLIIAYIYQGPSKMFGRLCAPCLHFG